MKLVQKQQDARQNWLRNTTKRCETGHKAAKNKAKQQQNWLVKQKKRCNPNGQKATTTYFILNPRSA